jgi:hypothetical protein
MSNYSDLSLKITNFNAIKKLDTDNNKKISIEELKVIDSNKDGKIDHSEFDSVGINDPIIRNEIEKSLTGKIDSSKSKTVFSFLDLDKKIKTLETKQKKLINETKEYVSNELSGANPRAIINQVADNDDNGLITIGEIKQIDKDKFIHLALDSKEEGLDKKIDEINNKIKILDGANPNTVILELDKDSDFKSYWKYRGDCPSGEIDSLEKKDKNYKILKEKIVKLENDPNRTQKENKELESLKDKFEITSNNLNKIKNDLLNKNGNNKELTSLLENLESKSGISYVDLQAIKRIANKNGIDKLAEISSIIQSFINDNKGSFTLDQKIQIASDIFHDMAYPEHIDQKSKGTCAATAIQMKLAIRDPIKYSKLCTSLANDESFKLDNNKEIRHNKTYKTDKDDDRSLSCKILQNSLMDFAHSQNPKEFSYVQKGVRIHYDSRLSVDSAQGKTIQDTLKDVAKNIEGLKRATHKQLESLGDGLDDKESLALEKSLFGKVNGFFDIKTKKDKNIVIKSINQDLENKKPVVIGFEGHAVLINNLEKNNKSDKYVINSWSGQYELSEEQLRKVLDSTFVSEIVKNK